MHVDIEVIHRLFCLAFSFSPVLIQRYHNLKLQVSESSLIQVNLCSCAGGQALML